MAIDLKKIQAKFAGTPEDAAYWQHEEDYQARYQAYRNELNEDKIFWEIKAAEDKKDKAAQQQIITEFNERRAALAGKYKINE